MITNADVLTFFQQNPALSASVIEQEAGIPTTTLTKALAGDRVLNAKHLGSLYPILKKYGYVDISSRKAKVISIANHKGGVGKTTTTLNLGKALSLLGNRVLLIDLDSQGNLSQVLGVEEPQKQVVHSLLKNEPLPIVSISNNFDLSPSDLELANADLELVQAVGGVNQLKNVISGLRAQYDYILIDCPPALNIFTNSALVASNSCLIALQPEASAMKGINNLFERIMQVRDRINHELKVEGIVLTLVDKRLNVHRDMVNYIRGGVLTNFTVFNAEIRLNVALKESQIAQQDIFTYAKDSHGAIDYRNLALELSGQRAGLA